MQRSRYVVVAVLATLLGGCGSGDDQASSATKPSWVSAAPSTAPSASTSASASASPSASATTAAAADWSAKAKKLNAALAKVPGAYSVAVLDKKTGQKYAYRGTVSYDTASIAKAQILACMLLHDQAAGHGPTSGEMALAKPMIRLSDNNAATSLFQHVGGRSGVGACNRKLGLTHTVVNSAWGLTRTTANDQTRLLSEFVDAAGPLSSASRKTIFDLTSTVSSAQRWGVPSVAKSGETATVKNGWDTRSADGGLWAINTIGRVTGRGGEVNVSIAVLSHDNRSMSSGVTLVQKVAKLTRQYLGF
ncbi:serine hydrolase [Actinoplanes sp. NPDC026619]|uniref:serine hydrolase n=1 Tax=Actinoplanes sp. NPDC026619 TaxID=3155798 RepID=UPI0033D145D1